jgi:hypothetical protein
MHILTQVMMGKKDLIIIYLIISLLKATFTLFRSGAKSACPIQNVQLSEAG